MQEIEKIEELKRSMMKKVSNREPIPGEVIQTIQKAFSDLLNIYRDLHCDNLAIQQYIEESLGQAIAEVTKNVGEDRKETQLKQIQQICTKIEKELEDAEIQLNKTKMEEEQKQEILQIESGEQHTTTRIIGMVENFLRNVQSKQNRILNSHGITMDKIESVQKEAQEFIRYFVSRNEGEIYGILEKDNNFLKEQLLEEYEEYRLQNRQNEAGDEEEKSKKSKREEFVDGLDGKISLEEQRDFSRNYTAKMNEHKLKKEEEKKRIRRFTKQYFGIRRNYGKLYI